MSSSGDVTVVGERKLAGPILALVCAGIGAAVYSYARFRSDERQRLSIRVVQLVARQARLHREDFDDKCPPPPEFTDSEGRALQFTCPGVHDRVGADVVATGPDGVFGTSDDIKSWEL